MTMWRMRIAGWKPKATNTYSENEIFIAFPLQHAGWKPKATNTYSENEIFIAFSLQQLLHELA